jgi:hypothetical protein
MKGALLHKPGKSLKPTSEAAVGEPWSPIRTYEIMQWQHYEFV